MRTDARPEDTLLLKAETADALTLTQSDRGRMYVHTDAQQAAELQPVGTGGTPTKVSADDTLVLPAARAPGYSGPLRRASQFYEDGRGYPSPLGWRGDSGR